MPSSNTKATCLSLLTLLLLTQYVTTLIIPEEVPTILSLIYSNIPPIKKGTDSRLGVGFRLGEHADFQIIVELGPQTYTDPIGNSVDSKRKRAATLIAAMKGELGPWAQSVAKYQVEQKLKKMLESYKLSTENPVKTQNDLNETTDNKSEGSEWLSKWSKGLVMNSGGGVVADKPKQKILPNVNRMRVINSNGNNGAKKDDSAVNDMNVLKKLFGNNVNETRSVE